MRRPTARLRRFALAGLLLLVACGTGVGSIPGVYSTGDVRILGMEPDVRECLVYEGIWLALLGENLGDADAWEAGENQVVFPPNPPGIVADQVRLEGDALFVLVPDGASSGTLLIDAGASGRAEIPIVVEGSTTTTPQARMIATICNSNPPPGS